MAGAERLEWTLDPFYHEPVRERCARNGDGAPPVACAEVTARLSAADRSQAEGHREVADELRRTAERIAHVHLAELAPDGDGHRT